MPAPHHRHPIIDTKGGLGMAEDDGLDQDDVRHKTSSRSDTGHLAVRPMIKWCCPDKIAGFRGRYAEAPRRA